MNVELSFGPPTPLVIGLSVAVKGAGEFFSEAYILSLGGGDGWWWLRPILVLS